jgi:hypothetical protein
MPGILDLSLTRGFSHGLGQKQTCFSKPTKRECLHAIARTFGLLGADG